jgi:hypothetical protein
MTSTRQRRYHSNRQRQWLYADDSCCGRQRRSLSHRRRTGPRADNTSLDTGLRWKRGRPTLRANSDSRDRRRASRRRAGGERRRLPRACRPGDCDRRTAVVSRAGRARRPAVRDEAVYCATGGWTDGGHLYALDRNSPMALRQCSGS